MSSEDPLHVPIPIEEDGVSSSIDPSTKRNPSISFSKNTNLKPSSNLQGDTMPLFNKYYTDKEGNSIPFMKKTITITKENFWYIPLALFALIQLIFFASGNQSETNPLFRFVKISYFDKNTGLYGKGINDLCFVFTYMIFFTFFRDFIMFMLIRPLTIHVFHVYKIGKIKRMMEQCYSIVYYGISGPVGLFVMKYHSNLWLFNTENMYKSYPDIQLGYYFKLYYLVQAAFWLQQACILVLQLEKPRKDYHELIFHHIVTLLLIWLSYVFHFQQMGLSIYITMDISDFFLSFSKVLNYLESILITPFFLIFIGSWIYLRHYINLKILYSIIWEFKETGPYILDFAQQQYKCWISRPIIFVLIFSLQCLNLFWLFLILRILYRFIFLGVQKDERSDSEDEDEDEDILKKD
ncbi:sphingosine N-acyltransferase lag1 [Hanseniaspora valbyensis]